MIIKSDLKINQDLLFVVLFKVQTVPVKYCKDSLLRGYHGLYATLKMAVSS